MRLPTGAPRFPHWAYPGPVMIKGFGNSAQGCPSLSLALWADAWLSGGTSPDAALDGLSSWADLHLVTTESAEAADAAGLDWPGTQDSGGVALLGLIRRLVGPGQIRLLLPAAGDTRGLTPGTDHTRDAISAGETLILLPAKPVGAYRGIGLIPIREGRDVIRWAVHGLPASDATPLAQPRALGEARHELREAVRDAAELFTRIHTVGASPAAARARITELTERAQDHALPPTVSPRVSDVLDSAAMVAAILTVAGESAGGDAATTSAAALAEDSLRQLWGIVREARLAAVAEASREMAGRSPAAAPLPESAQAPRGGQGS